MRFSRSGSQGENQRKGAGETPAVRTAKRTIAHGEPSIVSMLVVTWGTGRIAYATERQMRDGRQDALRDSGQAGATRETAVQKRG